LSLLTQAAAAHSERYGKRPYAQAASDALVDLIRQDMAAGITLRQAIEANTLYGLRRACLRSVGETV